MFYQINFKTIIKEFVAIHTNCRNDATYFMYSDPSKIEMKSLSDRFPLEKKSQQIFKNKVCFISNKW